MIPAACPRFEVFLSNVRADVRAYVVLPSFLQCAPSTGHNDLPVSVHIRLLLSVRLVFYLFVPHVSFSLSVTLDFVLIQFPPCVSRRLSGPPLARRGAESTGETMLSVSLQ